jgi:predicted nucleotidyltransferase
MVTADTIINTLNTDKQVLKNFHLARIGLFGSVARGTQNENSDLDFLIEFEEGYKNFKNFMKIAIYLEEHFGENFDMVTKESLTPFIYSSILKDIKYVQVID